MFRRTIAMLLLGTALPFLIGAATVVFYMSRQYTESGAKAQAIPDVAHSAPRTSAPRYAVEATDHAAAPDEGGAPSTPSAAPVELEYAPKSAMRGAAPETLRLVDDSRSFRQQPTHGLLTAGVQDDVIQWEGYLDYLQKSMQHDRHELLPRAGLGKRLFIQVVDQHQRPVQNALVTLRSASGKLLSHRTAADGMVQYISGYDGAAQAKEVKVETAAETITQEIADDDSTLVVTLKETDGEMPQALDLALVIDTTGSMGDELSYLQKEIQHITSQVAEMFPNVDQRFALIVYRDNGDEYVMRSYDFTGDIRTFQSQLDQQTASGGGDTPEAMDVAMQRVLTLDWRSGQTARMVFLVGDAPPHDPDLDETLATSGPCRERAIRIYPVAASGVRDKAEYLLRSLAALTGGQYLFLTDHSGIGNAHHDPHVDQYSVESLEQAMLRMVSSELTGKRLGPDEILAIESGKLHYEQIEHDDYTHLVYHPPQLPSQEQVQPRPTQQPTYTVSVPMTPPTPYVYVGATQPSTPWQSFLRNMDRMAMPFALLNFAIGAVFLGVCLWQSQRRLQVVADAVSHTNATLPSELRKPPQF